MTPLDKEVAEFMEGLNYVFSKRDGLWHLWVKNSDREIARIAPQAATFFYTAFKAQREQIFGEVRKVVNDSEAVAKHGKLWAYIKDLDIGIDELEAQLNQTKLEKRQ